MNIKQANVLEANSREWEPHKRWSGPMLSINYDYESHFLCFPHPPHSATLSIIKRNNLSFKPSYWILPHNGMYCLLCISQCRMWAMWVIFANHDLWSVDVCGGCGQHRLQLRHWPEVMTGHGAAYTYTRTRARACSCFSPNRPSPLPWFFKEYEVILHRGQINSYDIRGERREHVVIT